MQRAAIYARFSTDLQNERSTEDQIELCRKFATSRGYTVVAVYQDQAKSGASLHGRDGAGDMLIHAMKDTFDAIIVESLDRLSRDMEDMSGMYKRLSFAGVEIIPVDTGRAANTVEVGLRGLISQLYREDNVHKVRRGMAGLVRRNLSAGGKIYGYTNDPLNTGHLLIKEEEADIVRRIFEEFAAGRSPKAMCHALNKEGVPPPRGKLWSPSALNGAEERAAGILRNSIYIGVRTWNKTTWVKNPSTGRRVPRNNPRDQWQTSDVPHLRLIDDELWAKVHARLAESGGKRAEYSKRPQRLFSGLLACGACGSGMHTGGKDKTGKTRLRCSAHVNSGSCPDPQTYYLDRVENLIIDSLCHHLDEPSLIEEYFQTYEAERRQLNKGKVEKRGKLQKQIAAIDEETNRLIDFVAKGIGNAAVWGAKVDDLCRQKAELVDELNSCGDVDDKVALHPTKIKQMAKSLGTVRKLVDTTNIEATDPAAQIIRDVIGKVKISRAPGTSDGIQIEVLGKLAAFSSVAALVAEVRYKRNHRQVEPVFSYTYRGAKPKA